MLNKIKLKNFKCFSDLDIELSELNVFSGINGMGKSTVIQTLLLLKQSMAQTSTLNQIFLNGNYVSLGTGQDVLYENASDDVIQIKFYENEVTTELKLEYDAMSDVLNVSEPVDKICPSFYNEFEYLSAERLSPQTNYEKSSYFIKNNVIGINGQYTAHYLAIHQDDFVEGDGTGVDGSLKEKLQFWLNEISPNVKLNITQIVNADLAQINYYYTGLKDSTKTREYRPTNVGFGISYILPIITALLKAKEGSILIIENPEAHLHPKGQRKIGELIAASAARGVQIFLETHSDHVMNGIRIMVKNKKINTNQVKVFFFNNYYNISAHSVDNPKILENGRFDFWPDGFFDEWEKALDEII